MRILFNLFENDKHIVVVVAFICFWVGPVASEIYLYVYKVRILLAGLVVWLGELCKATLTSTITTSTNTLFIVV